ncbi:hypothetical protein SAMN05421805_12792 [Saccharopolyspora antimicrobica]|uniref:Uncharacterized protein n=1 Tax=Saccharopolyspora antimicrobica TaxID=455193 RepID=A0A1I5KMX4_9PSEU|nr:hypothetical protein [Saccharopolyspora antimicrobica]RKT85605.1 hypothetical protein ATL45_3952 [Saccharopolyspora antimicrobica]SFO86454.1 hypothetical protein SAMN05421805_12792 [Saccharopolyspora antimicrobica]
MPTVIAPTNYTGTVVGVALIDGRGETTDPAALAYFRRHGYTIGDDQALDEHQAQDAPDIERPSRTARKSDWVAYAIARGMPQDDAESLTRDDLARLYHDDEG